MAIFALLLFNWISPAKEMGQAINSAGQGNASAVEKPSLSELVAVPLFGKAPPQVVLNKPVKRKITTPVQPLRIRVLGVVSAGEKSAALILHAGKKEQQVVFVGDYIQPGVKLQFVDADAVVVEQHGKLRRIRLEYGKKLNPTPMLLKPVRPGKPAVEKAKASRPKQKRAAAQPKDHLDISTLMTQGQLELHKTGDKVDGLLITHIVVGSIFHKLGMYNEDIIHNINGIQFFQKSQINDLYRELIKSTSINMDVIRNGKIKHLGYKAE